MVLGELQSEENSRSIHLFSHSGRNSLPLDNRNYDAFATSINTKDGAKLIRADYNHSGTALKKQESVVTMFLLLPFDGIILVNELRF